GDRASAARGAARARGRAHRARAAADGRTPDADGGAARDLAQGVVGEDPRLRDPGPGRRGGGPGGRVSSRRGPLPEIPLEPGTRIVADLHLDLGDAEGPRAFLT